MRTLWLYIFIICRLSRAIAQNSSSSSSSCNISLAGHVSVPELCLSAQEAATRLLSRVLNFTLAENGSLIFEPLPHARQVNVEVEDESNGLKAWANLANSFVDSVRSGSLPYDVIISVINSSLDSPIECTSGQQHNSHDDFEFRDVLDDFGEWWTPIILVTVLGPVFALLFIITGCCLCCCRFCSKCGRVLKQKHKYSHDKRCIILFAMLSSCVCLLFIGVVFAFVSNESVNKSIQNFEKNVNVALNNSLNFVDDIQMQANATVDRYDEINTFIQCQVDNSHITIGRVVLDVFEEAVNPLINSSLELAVDLNNSISSLRLQTELDGLTAMFQTLDANCRNASLGSNCNAIPTQSYSVVDYTLVDDVTAVLNELELIGDIAEPVLEANATFYGIPCDIRNQIQDQAREILNRADEFQETIKGIADDTELELSKVLDEKGFIGDIRSRSHDIQSSLDQYDTPRYAISILFCTLTLIVIVVLTLGLLLGAIGFRRNAKPFERTRISNCGGVTLIYFGVPLIFVFAVILLFLASITFFLGANMLKVCYSIAEDPPNNDIPSYELYSQIVDNSELWGGYLLGWFILDNCSVPLTMADMLNGCKANHPIYQVAQLRHRPNLSLEEVTNITNEIPDLDQLFADLEESIEFSLDQILTQETRDSLNSFANAGLQSIDYATYINKVTSQTSTLAIDSTTETLQRVQNGFIEFSQPALANNTWDIINEITRINQTTIVEIYNSTELLERQITMLNESAMLLNRTVQGILDDANATFAQLSGPTGSQLVVNQTRIVLEHFIAYATDFANWAINNLENEIGRCRPLYATYINLYYEVCEDAVDGINGFWLAIGWCVLFFIPTLVFTACLSCYFRSAEKPDAVFEDCICLENTRIPPALRPPHWDPQPVGTNGRPNICHVVTLASNSEEYNNALKTFHITLPPSLCEIIAVKRIQNPQLYRKYLTMKADMKENCPEDCQLERELFHGTTKNACNDINHQGFNKIFAGKNATRFGKGVYFAVKAQYSSKKTYSPEDENGYKYIYSCLVLTGEYTKGDDSMTVPPPKNPTKNPHILFDSLVDNMSNPEIFVAAKDEQAYPNYLIVFKMKN
ncbi:prominin-1-A-like isoform X2 [Dysidea avara]|uniref:prominin-1-A-like isoform X2 n=1 Tax=Dysidea avara TaxID=196820 RepID=UPI00332E5BA7